uniref:ATP-sensitive inward rectifier potassium channel 11-like n=1 Tax=Petromyzon marinus TaxID=7757 RepID=A0AAJ7UJ57_PETMA
MAAVAAEVHAKNFLSAQLRGPRLVPWAADLQPPPAAAADPQQPPHSPCVRGVRSFPSSPPPAAAAAPAAADLPPAPASPPAPPPPAADLPPPAAADLPPPPAADPPPQPPHSPCVRGVRSFPSSPPPSPPAPPPPAPDLPAAAAADLPPPAAPHPPQPPHSPCVRGVRSFPSSFLFSLELQTALGFGARAPSGACAGGLAWTVASVGLVAAQCLWGLAASSVLLGCVFVRTATARSRAGTLLFSRRAVVALRDGRLCLMVRVADLRASMIVRASVKMQVVEGSRTQEGEVDLLHQVDLRVEGGGGGGGGAGGSSSSSSSSSILFLVAPIVVVHPIGPASPLYRLSAAQLAAHPQLEVVVLLQGVVESTGTTTQARASYRPADIAWGHRFVPMSSGGDTRGHHGGDTRRHGGDTRRHHGGDTWRH